MQQIIDKENVINFILMHEDVEVAECSFDIFKKTFTDIFVINSAHMPLCPLDEWIKRRCISYRRPNIDEILKKANAINEIHLSILSRGFSLTDHYWFRPSDDIFWDDKNFFHNNYSLSFGNNAFCKSNESFDLNSPDITTNGIMRKTWRRFGGADFLFKAGTAPEFQEPLNEYMASAILKENFNVPFVSSSLAYVNNELCSKTQSFLGDKFEFVPMSDIIVDRTLDGKELYNAIVSFCNNNKVQGIEDFLKEMMEFDYLINNPDRHLGNFGLLRDAISLQFTGIAPLFDNGTSFWNKTEYPKLNEYVLTSPQLHSFKKKLLKKLNRQIDLEKLQETIKKIKEKDTVKNNLEQDKFDFIFKNLDKRIKTLDKCLDRSELTKEDEYEI